MMSERSKKAMKIASMVALFFVSLVFFLYLTFPYEVLKETISNVIAKETGYLVRIDELGPSLPVGVVAHDVTIEPPTGNAMLRLKMVDVDVGLLSLFIGKLAVNLEVVQGDGYVDVSFDLGLLKLINGAVIPEDIAMSASSFPIEGVSNFALAAASSDNAANPIVAQLLAAIGLKGALNGLAEIELNSRSPTQSKGKLDLQIQKGALYFNDASFGIADQNFSKALVKAQVDGGRVVFDPNSGFLSDELGIGMSGQIVLNADLPSSQLDMKMSIDLKKSLKEKFGYILQGFTGGMGTEGQLTFQIRGPLSAPSVATF